jgi:nickel/cobalt transporter (NicO) family protein
MTEIWSQAVLLGGWFGLLHAFDADHLATIGGLALRDRSLPATGYALRWALGHAAALGIVATVVLGIGVAAAADWSAHGDALVALALFAIGLQALRIGWQWLRVARRGFALPLATGAHSHGAHVHFLARWHSHGTPGRTSVALGVLHGGAGSAAVLALLPLARFGSGLAAAVYLACFSIGVTVGALAFARVFALLAHRTTAAGERLAAAFHTAVGAFALVSGGILLHEMLAHAS